MEFLQLLQERYSVRTLSTAPVEDAMLAAILEAARLAPTALNKQPYRILVLRSPESMEKLRKCTPYTFGASLALAVCACPEEAWVRPYDACNSALIDAAIVGAHIMLAVHDFGLGATWVGHFDAAVFRKAFGLPESMEPVAIFPIGHPAANAKPAPQHSERRPLEETVVYEHF